MLDGKTMQKQIVTIISIINIYIFLFAMLCLTHKISFILNAELGVSFYILVCTRTG